MKEGHQNGLFKPTRVVIGSVLLTVRYGSVLADPDLNCSLYLGSDQAALAVRHGLLDAYTEVANTAVTDSGQQACFQVSPFSQQRDTFLWL